MRSLKLAGSSLVALLVLISAGLLYAQPGNLPLKSNADESPSSSRPFTGSLTVRQKAGSLYYKVFVLSGRVIGGYDTWQGNSTHYHKVVGGWYDGQRMVLLIQSTQDDLGDKWYSQEHQFEKDGDQFIIKHTLYGFGKTLATGEVYEPHTIDDIREMPAEEVQKLAASDKELKPTTTAADSSRAALEQRLKRMERENTRLKELVGGLLLEKTTLEDKLRKGRPK